MDTTCPSLDSYYLMDTRMDSFIEQLDARVDTFQLELDSRMDPFFV